MLFYCTDVPFLFNRYPLSHRQHITLKAQKRLHLFKRNSQLYDEQVLSLLVAITMSLIFAVTPIIFLTSFWKRTSRLNECYPSRILSINLKTMDHFSAHLSTRDSLIYCVSLFPLMFWMILHPSYCKIVESGLYCVLADIFVLWKSHEQTFNYQH